MGAVAGREDPGGAVGEGFDSRLAVQAEQAGPERLLSQEQEDREGGGGEKGREVEGDAGAEGGGDRLAVAVGQVGDPALGLARGKAGLTASGQGGDSRVGDTRGVSRPAAPRPSTDAGPGGSSTTSRRANPGRRPTSSSATSAPSECPTSRSTGVAPGDRAVAATVSATSPARSATDSPASARGLDPCPRRSTASTR